MATYKTREEAIAAQVRKQTLAQMAQGRRFSTFALSMLLRR